MAKTVPTSYDATALDTSRARASAFITVDEWTDVFERLHYLWAHTGARSQGVIFPDVFKTTSATYTTTTTSGDYNLDTVYPVMLPIRRSETGGSKIYMPSFTFYGRYIEVQQTVIRFNGGSNTQIAQYSGSTSSGDWEWVEVSSSDEVEATHHVSGSTANPVATIGVYFEAKIATGATAELFCIQPFEEVPLAANLPTS